MNQQRTIVVALGGNALQRQGEASSQAQQRVADETIAQLLPLIQAGHRVARRSATLSYTRRRLTPRRCRACRWKILVR